MEADKLRTKSELRRQILVKRDALTEEEQRKASILMTERIMGHQWYYCSDRVLLFFSFGSEINTYDLLKETLNKGKKLYLPKVHQSTMEFYRVTSLDELLPGYRGIPEPSEAAERYVYAETDEKQPLLIMPGVAFDRYRNRCGYGKGYYDRYFAGKTAIMEHSIGICHTCQMVDEIEMDAFDLKPYQVLHF